MLRTISRAACQVARPAVRHVGGYIGGKRYDLFGYEQSMETGPYIERINKCQYFDDAGEVIVEMNLKNTPPDLKTYNAVLKKILDAPSKSANPLEGESKLCAMFDLLEEMAHRYKMKPDNESWTYVLQQLDRDGDWRLGLLTVRGLEADGFAVPADLKNKFEEQQRQLQDRPIRNEAIPADIFDVKVVTW
jgi:hypothetical protein